MTALPTTLEEALAEVQQLRADLIEMRDDWAATVRAKLEVDAALTAVKKQLQAAQKADIDRLRDESRLRAIAREPLFDELCGIDIHEQAAIYASAFGRDEPNEDDYLAAVRDQLDALIRRQEQGEQQ